MFSQLQMGYGAGLKRMEQRKTTEKLFLVMMFALEGL